jgi:2-oxoglutarate/2-oxoacid ferredoxin oxidoreductase subunit alpha
VLGQMKEALVAHAYVSPDNLPAKDWAVSGKDGRSQRVVKSLYLGDGELEEHNWKLHRKYQELKDKEVRYEAGNLDDARLVVTAFGSTARIAKTAIRMAREEGLKVGLLRPITLFPFPEKVFLETTAKAKRVLCFELNTGQMVEDVRLSVARDADVFFYGRPPGAGSLPTPEEFLAQIRKHYKD